MSADLPERPGFRLLTAQTSLPGERPSWERSERYLHLVASAKVSRAHIAPTGTGKTAIGVAARHVLRPRRTLVVVPSTALRQQTADIYSSEEVLRAISALDSETRPTVRQVRGQIDDWKDLEQDDVVIAIPASISPAHYEQNLPPKDLFDLIVVDEAHHSRQGPGSPFWNTSKPRNESF
jgi:superfamily II DNA or RNA helicase